VAEDRPKPRILLQLDGDPQPSVFDAVVATDAGAEFLLRHGSVRPEQVRDLVYGAVFTRGPDDLKHTAIFVGGSDVTAAEAVLQEVMRTFFGPFRVSVMMDANGANTTAAAAVLAARAHVDLKGATALVLAATGPVGQRVVHLLAREGAEVRAASRSLHRAQSVCQRMGERLPDARVSAWATGDEDQVRVAAAGAQVVIAAGAPGVMLMSAQVRKESRDLQVAIDLNAVQPAGLEGIEPGARAQRLDGVVGYGAIGVGITKMKIHKAAIRRLFDTSDQVFDAEEIYRLGCALS